MTLNTQKANKWTLILIGSAVISVVVFALILDTGESYDGAQVQGGVILLCGAMMSIAAVLIGFPLAVKIMLRSGHIGFLPFASCTVGILLGFSAIVPIALGAVGFGFSGEHLVRLGVVVLVLSVLLSLPLAIFWWLIATKRHNKRVQPIAEKSGSG
jgi:hypothetical protein